MYNNSLTFAHNKGSGEKVTQDPPVAELFQTQEATTKLKVTLDSNYMEFH